MTSISCHIYHLENLKSEFVVTSIVFTEPPPRSMKLGELLSSAMVKDLLILMNAAFTAFGGIIQDNHVRLSILCNYF